MNSTEKLQHDLKVLERFGEDIAAYLRSSTLFYPTGPNYPELTVGGLLMRQHRLLLCKAQLTTDERSRLDRCIAAFQAALEGNLVSFEKKAHKELAYRHRQWRERVRELIEQPDERNFYRNGVEPRLMIAAIVQQLELPPFELNSDVPERVESVDMGLRARWIKGDFVLQAALADAYPQESYWYLYGEPAEPVSR